MAQNYNLSITTGREGLFLSPPTGREADYKNVVKALFNLGNNRTERLAMMFASADLTVRDEMAVLVAILQFGRIVRFQRDVWHQTWSDWIPARIESDFLGMLWLFQHGMKQDWEVRQREGIFIPGAIDKISQAAYEILGHRPKLRLDELNIELFHKAIFAGIKDKLYVSIGRDLWTGTDGKSRKRDNSTTVRNADSKLLAGLVLEVSGKDGRKFSFVGPVFPLLPTQAIEWGGGLYKRPERLVVYNEGQDTILAMSRIEIPGDEPGFAISHDSWSMTSKQEKCEKLIQMLFEQTTHIAGQGRTKWHSPAWMRIHPVLKVVAKLYEQLFSRNNDKVFARLLLEHYTAVIGEEVTSLTDLVPEALTWTTGQQLVDNMKEAEPTTIKVGANTLKLRWEDGIPFIDLMSCHFEEVASEAKGQDVLAGGKLVQFSVLHRVTGHKLETGTLREILAERHLQTLLLTAKPQMPPVPSPFDGGKAPALTPVKVNQTVTGFWALQLVAGATYTWVLRASETQAKRIHTPSATEFNKQVARLG